MVGLAVALSGVRLALVLVDGLLLGVLLGGDLLGEGEIDIGLSGEVTSALRFLCGVCCWLYFVLLSRLAVSAGLLVRFFFLECRLLFRFF